MGLHEIDLTLSEAYRGQMLESYSSSIVEAIAEDWKFADLPHQPGEQLIYVRVGQETASYDRPVLYVPGFTEGIVAKAPLAAEMAERGFDFILPGQNRKQVMRDTLNKKNATYSQAMNYLAVLTAEDLEDQTVDVVTHSYGSLIFQAMLKIANERGQATFKDAKLVELAPTGTNAREGLLKLAGRFGLLHLLQEARTKKDFPDPNGEMMKAGAKNFLANIPRALREIRDLSKNRMAYDELAVSDLADITVLGYGEDKAFPHRVLKTTMEDALKYDVSYATPISLEDDNGSIRGKKDASHNDEQFNPSRVAGAVAQILRTA